ncbi:MAG: TspO protein [Proteobacteria bacterium ST_bin13]|nr:MAG: TspO protein [Proteobacteria bacterium ST_bin13]
MEIPVIIAIGVAVLLGGAGGAMTPIGPWYHNLKKPSLQPPNWLFGPAWSIILGLAAWSAITAWYAADTRPEQARVICLFSTNAVCHFLWSPLFFRAQRPDWALVEVVFLWVSLVLLVVLLWPISPFASALVMPYLAWVSFAAWLNSAIVKLNRPFG